MKPEPIIRIRALSLFAAAKARSARYVRVFATKRWRRAERLWAIALAELMVLSNGSDVALGQRVYCKLGHSLEYPPIWSARNLVDGQSDLGLPSSSNISTINGYEAHASI